MLLPETQSTTKLLAATYEAFEAMQEPASPVLPTCLRRDDILSDRYKADVWLASEMHQPIGAYKIRGGYNFMRHQDSGSNIVTASAGNHAQAIALCASTLNQPANIFMPVNTPWQKVERVHKFGKNVVSVHLTGATFDEAYEAAQEHCAATDAVFAHPFDDELVIAGQGTLGVEIAEHPVAFDAVVCPVGGGGLVSGVGSVVKALRPGADIVGVEPTAAASMTLALDDGRASKLRTVDTFVDGAAVKQVGRLTYGYAAQLGLRMQQVSNQELRQTTSELWERGIRAELAGSLAVSGLARIADYIRGSRVVCVVSGGNLSQERFDKEVKLAQS